MGIASFRPGARDKGPRQLKPEEAELEEFLFENQIDFVSDQARVAFFGGDILVGLVCVGCVNVKFCLGSVCHR